MPDPSRNLTGDPTSIADPALDVDGARVGLLLAGAVENLTATWNAELGRFPFSSRRVGATIVHEYRHPVVARYTINSLLGLASAARIGGLGVSEIEVEAMANRFLATAPQQDLTPADHGLLALLQCELGAGYAEIRDRAQVIARLLERDGSGLNMQDVAWLLWGSAAIHRAGFGLGADLVRVGLDLIAGRLVDAQTGLPRHATARYRSNVVSFGSLVYFLRAMNEAAQTLGDDRIQALSDAGVARALSLQGPGGEWPWMIDCRSGRPFDVYPVFAVHQDSMAMLFLLPALDRGLAGVRAAITRSLAWDFGDNELGATMFTEGPFFAYRAIERSERIPRVRRYARSLASRAGLAGGPGYARETRLNDECRSYHLGWILFAWSSRPDFWRRPAARERVGLPA